MSYLIKGVEALYPKIDRPYQWSDKDNRSMPCKAIDTNAEYTLNLKVPYAKALELRKAMLSVYEEKKEAKWPKFKDNFKVLEGSVKNKDAVFEIKTKLKAAYNGEQTRPVRQFDAQQNVLPADFQLTTGSIVNVAVTFSAYSTGTYNGTTLRLNAVQVIQLATSNVTSPFEKEEGFTFGDANPFVEVEEEVTDEIFPTETLESGDEWEESKEPEEPKKVTKKEKPTPKVKDNDDDLDDIINEWGDD
tara:strand:+ start:7740 stop:8477 length:738 start_codon:yes stop_codon:yes gene_type:complete